MKMDVGLKYMKEFKDKIIIAIISLLIGLSISLFKKPEVQIKEVKVKEISYVENKSEKKDVVKKRKETKNVDGSIIIEEEEIDKSQIDTSKKLDEITKQTYELTQKNTNKRHTFELYMKSDDLKKLIPEISYAYNREIFFGRVRLDKELKYELNAGIKLEF